MRWPYLNPCRDIKDNMCWTYEGLDGRVWFLRWHEEKKILTQLPSKDGNLGLSQLGVRLPECPAILILRKEAKTNAKWLNEDVIESPHQKDVA